MTLTELITEINLLLEHEERNRPPTSLADLQNHHLIRHTIELHLQTILNTIQQVQRRIGALPKLPSLQEAYWAWAMLEMPNLAFLEVDTDGLGTDANVVRVLLMDRARRVLFDTCIAPPRPLSEKLLAITGLTREQLEQAPSVDVIWPSLTQALSGRYLLSYNLAFDQNMLQALADRAQLHLPYLVAECLMERATSYFRSSQYPKLADLCTRIGSPLPAHPQQNAYHRAMGQLAVLETMAQGLTTHVSDDEDENEERPF